jgi:20S proteasome alpha/beta subunit
MDVLKGYFDLEQHTVQETNEKEALRLALKALKMAAEEVHVSPPELYPPTVVIITEKEYRNLPEEKVENLIDVLGIKRRGR